MKNKMKTQHMNGTAGITSIILALVLSIALVFSLLALTGCGEDEGVGKAESAQQGQQNDSGSANENTDKADVDLQDESGVATKEFVDSCNRKVEIPEKLTQVVPSGPLAQIMLYAIAPETLMATPGKWSEDARRYVPKEYQELPEIGSFFGSHDLNYEEIARLSPQLVIDVGEDKPSMKADLEDITTKTGIPAVHITANYDDLDVAFEKLGELYGRPEEAKALADYCREAYKDVDKTLKKVEKKKRVMYCTQEDGLNVLAKDSYHSQIVDLIGDNVSELTDPSSQGSGNEVNMEQMLVWDPEIIIFAPDSYYDYVADDPAWAQLSAIRNKKYYEVPSGPYNWMGSPPSSNRIMGMLWMAKLLYPKQADYDMVRKTKDYYKLFYHYDLSDAEYDGLVKKSLEK